MHLGTSIKTCFQLFGDSMKSNSIIAKTFGGLSAQYYFRHFVFGLVLSVIYFFSIPEEADQLLLSASIAWIIVNTLLYPYSRFVYESIVNFIMGENVFFVNAIMMLVVKLFTMLLCWGFAVFIAPIGLIYLYLHNNQKPDE